MTNRITLLAAATALALPATMAGAQTTPPGGTAQRPAAHTQTPPPATPPASANTATEDAQATNAQAAETPSSASQAAEPGTQTDATAQTQAATPPAGQPAAAEPAGGAVRLATAADLHAGVQVHDQQGGAVGTIESADATGAVVATGTVRARLPLASFGANSQGLVIAMTREQLNAAAAHTAPRPRAG